MGYAFTGRLNRDIFHNFFYDDSPTRYAKAKSNNHYEGDCFYSYWTVVGQRLIGKDGAKILLISYDSMSSCTSRHLSYLREACPSNWERLSFPFKYGNSYELSHEEIRRRLEHEIMATEEESLSTEEGRRQLAAWSSTYRTLVKHMEWDDDRSREVMTELAKLDSLRADIENRRAASRERRLDTSPEAVARRAAEKEARRQRYERMVENIDNMPVMELMVKSFGNGLPKKDAECVRKWLLAPGGKFPENGVSTPFAEYMASGIAYRKSYHSHYRAWSLVWMKNNDFVRTSQGVVVDAYVVRDAFKAFDDMEDKQEFVGHTISGYSVNKVTDEEIVIGCHRIPMENINALRERLFPKEDK